MADLFSLDNMLEMSVAKEKATKRDEEAYKEFHTLLEKNESIYSNYKTYYIHMRYAEDELKGVYNSIKNELLSYVDAYDPDVRVQYELLEDAEIFYLGNVIAQIRISGGTLNLYLNLDPNQYDTSDAIHQDVSGDVQYRETPLLLKITKETRMVKALHLIRDLMTKNSCAKDEGFEPLDYSSFFCRDIISVSRIVEEENGEAKEAIVAISNRDELMEGDSIRIHAGLGEFTELTKSEDEREKTDDSEEEKYVEADVVTTENSQDVEESTEEQNYVFENVSSPEERPVFREVTGSGYVQIEDQEDFSDNRKSIFEEETPEEINGKGKKKKAKKPNVWKELADYGYNFVLLRQLQFYALALALGVGLGLIFKLEWPFILVIVAAVLIGLPGVLKSYYRNKYEEKRFRDAESYIEQMLYSFRRNSKILSSLRDVLVVFPSGYMHDRIIEAINSIQNAKGGGNVYGKALKIIEDAYPCRRVKALHRYMIKVEGVGGKHDSGISALLRDRRQWIDRTNHFRKECSSTIKEIIISGIFSLAMACVVVYMMPSDLYDLSSSVVYQIITTLFVLVNLWVIRVTLKSTVIYLQDSDDIHAEKTIRMINWLRNYDEGAEIVKSMKLSILFAVLVVVAFVAKSKLGVIAGLVLILYCMTLKRTLDYRRTRKQVIREIEKVYPDWLLELSLLIQTDNVHVAIQKTISTAPMILRADLQKLIIDIKNHPVDLAPYVTFFDFLPMENVQSSMKLLYSISEFGAVDESIQLSELVERNHTLMDRAEKYKNEDKLALVFSIKFLPSLASSIKMLADLMLFLFSYISIIGTLL